MANTQKKASGFSIIIREHVKALEKITHQFEQALMWGTPGKKKKPTRRKMKNNQHGK